MPTCIHGCSEMEVSKSPDSEEADVRHCWSERKRREKREERREKREERRDSWAETDMRGISMNGSTVSSFENFLRFGNRQATT
jgi:hypothetical protein